MVGGPTPPPGPGPQAPSAPRPPAQPQPPPADNADDIFTLNVGKKAPVAGRRQGRRAGPTPPPPHVPSGPIGALDADLDLGDAAETPAPKRPQAIGASRTNAFGVEDASEPKKPQGPSRQTSSVNRQAVAAGTSTSTSTTPMSPAEPTPAQGGPRFMGISRRKAVQQESRRGRRCFVQHALSGTMSPISTGALHDAQEPRGSAPDAGGAQPAEA